MTHPKSKSQDLAVLVTGTAVVTVLCNTQLRVLSRLPARVLQQTEEPGQILDRLLGRLVEQVGPRRVLLTCLDDPPYEDIAVPVFDALSVSCEQASTPLEWLPDIRRLVALVAPTANSPNNPDNAKAD